jgi:hypothetical protein
LFPELNLPCALVIEFIEWSDAKYAAMLVWHESDDPVHPKPRQIPDIIHITLIFQRICRIVQIQDCLQQQQTISLDTLKRSMQQMALAVAKHVADPQVLTAIEREWNAIRVA